MEVKEKSIVKIDPAQYGLTETKAKEIEAMFKPMLDKMVELEGEFNQIAGLEINEGICYKARELRLKYVKVRTGTANIHRELKAFYLNGGRFVDGWKNAQLFASQGIEEKLSAIENHYENLEKERIAKLQETRAAEMERLDPSYVDQYIPENLGEMSEDIWNNFIMGIKINYEARKDAEKKAEEERQEKIRLDKHELDRRERILPYHDYWQGIVDAGALRDLSDELFEDVFKELAAKKKEEDQKQEQIRKENLRLQEEAEQREKQAKIEAAKREKAEAERLAKEEAERKIREEKESQEREAYEVKLKKEREERERAEAELKAKKEAEEKARLEAEAKARAEEEARKKAEKDARLAPDKKKLERLASDISDIRFPDVKSQEAFEIIQKVRNQFEQINQFIITQSKNL